MATEVIMPKLGLTMNEGKILFWYKTEGETVKAGEPLLNVETDKVSLDVEAPASGVLLKILHLAGDSIPLETVIAHIGEIGEIPLAKMVEKENNTLMAPIDILENHELATGGNPTEGPLKVSPLAKKLAIENQIDLSDIKGSGPQGRIVETDIIHRIELKLGATSSGSSAELPSLHSTETLLPYRVFPVNNVRKVSAIRMTESFQTIPHFYLHREIVISRLVDLRNHLMPEFEIKPGFRLTYTDFFLRALALSLPKHPLLNASWNEGVVHCYQTVNIGIAIATHDGLVVGVIHGLEQLRLDEIACQRIALKEKAEAGNLTLKDVSDATFTLTNLGKYGVDDFSPIINPPQAAILACGAIVERPVGADGIIVLRPTLRFTLAVDHRIADGADAGLFFQELCGLLVSPEGLHE